MKNFDIFLVILMNFILGSSYAVGALGMGYFTPFFLYALRFFVSGFFSIYLIKFPKKDIWLIFFSSIFTTFSFLGLSLGIKNIDSSTSSIIIRFDVIFTIILSFFFFKEKITLKTIISSILCLLGLFIIKGGISVTNYKYFLILIGVSI